MSNIIHTVNRSTETTTWEVPAAVGVWTNNTFGKMICVCDVVEGGSVEPLDEIDDVFSDVGLRADDVIGDVGGGMRGMLLTFGTEGPMLELRGDEEGEEEEDDMEELETEHEEELSEDEESDKGGGGGA